MSARPIPLPAPTTTTTCLSSGFSGGMRLSFASSSSQYSMSNASCRSSAVYVLTRSAPRMTPMAAV